MSEMMGLDGFGDVRAKLAEEGSPGLGRNRVK